MADRTVLSLCVAAMLVVAARAQPGFPIGGRLPGMGGGGMFGPGVGLSSYPSRGFGGAGFGQQGYGYQQGFGQQGFGLEVLTCIAKDQNDLTSQVRLTITGTGKGRGRGYGGYGGVGGVGGIGGIGGGIPGIGGGYPGFGGIGGRPGGLGGIGGLGGGLGGFPGVGGIGGLGGGVGGLGGIGGIGGIGGLGRPGLGGLGFGGFGDDGFDDLFEFDDLFDDDPFDFDDDLDEFRIDGTFIPSVAQNKAGTYYVVITSFGRTADGCTGDALGPIYHRGGFGGGSPYGPYGGYGQSFWGGQQGPIGQLANPAIVGGSATIYSTHITGVSKNNLLGRGIALCRNINNGRCQGYIPYCCTIQRDSLSAMELFVGDSDDRGDFDFPLGGTNFAIDGGLGGNLASPATGTGIAANVGGTGGLF